MTSTQPLGIIDDISPLETAGTWTRGSTVLEIHQFDRLVPLTAVVADALKIPHSYNGRTERLAVMWWPLELVKEALAAGGWKAVA